MPFYLLSAEEPRGLLERLGYRLERVAIRRNVDYYLRRNSSHGSTLSGVVNAWVLARSDRPRSWRPSPRRWPPTSTTSRAAPPPRASTWGPWLAWWSTWCSAATPAWRPARTSSAQPEPAWRCWTGSTSTSANGSHWGINLHLTPRLLRVRVAAADAASSGLAVCAPRLSWRRAALASPAVGPAGSGPFGLLGCAGGEGTCAAATGCRPMKEKEAGRAMASNATGLCPSSEPIYIEEPAFSRWPFGSSKAAWIWLVFRLWLGWEWLQAGWSKVFGGNITWKVWDWGNAAYGLTGDGNIGWSGRHRGHRGRRPADRCRSAGRRGRVRHRRAGARHCR